MRGHRLPEGTRFAHAHEVGQHCSKCGVDGGLINRRDLVRARSDGGEVRHFDCAEAWFRVAKGRV